MPDTYIRIQQGGSELNVDSGGSIKLAAGAEFKIGNVTLHSGAAIPTLTASPGAVYFRSEGSVSRMYVNTSTGVSGSVWLSGSELA